MSKLQDKKTGRSLCERLYVDLDYSVEACSEMFNVSLKTIYRWINAGNWKEKKVESKALDYLINISLKRALNQSLNRYIEDPKNANIEILMSLLMQFNKQEKMDKTEN